jgi:hypothetical protein
MQAEQKEAVSTTTAAWAAQSRRAIAPSKQRFLARSLRTDGRAENPRGSLRRSDVVPRSRFGAGHSARELPEFVGLSHMGVVDASGSCQGSGSALNK